jgi:hypothetical protein
MTMPEGRNRSAKVGCRWLIGKGIASAAGAVVFYWIGAEGLGWWWDGLWLSMFGMLLGQVAGLALGSYILGHKSFESDVPSVLGNAIGIGIMVTLWLCLPEGTVAVLGHITRAGDGAAVGALLALVFEYLIDTPRRSS